MSPTGHTQRENTNRTGVALPARPVIYETNTWPWLRELSRQHNRRVTLADVPETAWDTLADLRFDVAHSPSLPDGVRNLHFLRNGLYLGELKKDRFEPSQPFAVTLSADKFKDYMNLKADDERTEKYLHGETISVEPGETASPSGWKLVCVDGFGLGWGKLVNGTLKNKYPVGWRK